MEFPAVDLSLDRPIIILWFCMGIADGAVGKLTPISEHLLVSTPAPIGCRHTTLGFQTGYPLVHF